MDNYFLLLFYVYISGTKIVKQSLCICSQSPVSILKNFLRGLCPLESPPAGGFKSAHPDPLLQKLLRQLRCSTFPTLNISEVTQRYSALVTPNPDWFRIETVEKSLKKITEEAGWCVHLLRFILCHLFSTLDLICIYKNIITNLPNGDDSKVNRRSLSLDTSVY